MLKNNTNKLKFQPLIVLLVSIIILSACQKQEMIFKPTNTIPVVPTEIQSEPMEVVINESPFRFNNPAQIINNELWLPAKEVFTLLERSEINKQGNYLSTNGRNFEGKEANCHYWIGKTGENTYSSDTENEIWYESAFAPFEFNGDVFLSEKMIEDCVGEFIHFSKDHNRVVLSLLDIPISLMQAENSNPVVIIQLKDSDYLKNTKVSSFISGVAQVPAADWYEWIDRLKPDGFTSTRINLNPSDGPAVTLDIANIEKGIPVEYLSIFDYFDKQGIETRYILSFWDLDYRQQGGEISYQRLSSEDEIERYLDYVRMVVTTLKGSVEGYELWNEPDANRDWFQRIEPEDYLEVARRVIPMIREIDPEAEIILASTSSYADPSCREYTHFIIDSDVVSLVDAIALHTVNNDASPIFISDYYYGYDQMWQELMSLAESHGFTGEYYADELNYRSDYSLSVLQPEVGDYHPYDPEIAAKYIGRMIAINLGLDIYVGTSGTNSEVRLAEGKMIRQMAYLTEGLKAAPLSVSVETTLGLPRFYTFVDEIGNQYLILWNDIEATLEGEDIKGSVMIDNITAKSVKAINPYLLNEQDLLFENVDGSVVINQLLIKDYPVMYKIEGSILE